MTDESIIDLYWQRSQCAIDETDKAYGDYCYTVANSVLDDQEDSKESVNDTYLAAWNAMPPTRPDNLRSFLGKLTRRIAISLLRKRTSQKRGGGKTAYVIDELEDCLPSTASVEHEIELRELTAVLNTFLNEQGIRERKIFVARYWYVMSIGDIAERLEMKPNTVKNVLFKTRCKLRLYLEKEGLT